MYGPFMANRVIQTLIYNLLLYLTSLLHMVVCRMYYIALCAKQNVIYGNLWACNPCIVICIVWPESYQDIQC